MVGVGVLGNINCWLELASVWTTDMAGHSGVYMR